MIISDAGGPGWFSNLRHSQEVFFRAAAGLILAFREAKITDMTDQRRSFDDQLYVHFLTFSVFRRRKLLDHDQPKRILLGVRGGQLRTWAGEMRRLRLGPLTNQTTRKPLAYVPGWRTNLGHHPLTYKFQGCPAVSKLPGPGPVDPQIEL